MLTYSGPPPVELPQHAQAKLPLCVAVFSAANHVQRNGIVPFAQRCLHT